MAHDIIVAFLEHAAMKLSEAITIPDASLAGLAPAGRRLVEQACEFAFPLYAGQTLSTGEDAAEHARGMLEAIATLNLDADAYHIILNGVVRGTGQIKMGRDLAISATPFFARIAEVSLREVDPGLIEAAQAMGYNTAVLDPDAESPAGVIAHHHVHADYSDPAGLIRLTGLAHAITTEFENVPAAALKELAESAPVAPGAAAVSICQDRAAEKAHFTACGVPLGATSASQPPAADKRARGGSSRLISPRPLRSTRISVRQPRGQPPPGSS